MARSEAEGVNAYLNTLNPFADWSWGSYFHEVGQFGIGEGKGFVNFAAGTVVYSSPELILLDEQTGGHLSSPLAASNESQADGAGTAEDIATVASFFTGEGEVAAGGRAAQRLAGADFVKGNPRFLGGKVANSSEINAIREELKALGANLKTNADAEIAAASRRKAIAAFDFETNTVLLPSRATHYQIFHEMSHARHYAEIGEEAYKNLDRAQREEHVFEKIMENEDKFSPFELAHAKQEIEKYR